MSERKLVRCAIYTRKSTEEGLDQAFNTLHAQREACEAYVKSQAGEGWKVLPAAYDDGGFSGGNMERPGLVRLLADVDAGLVDIVVVYKVDRLTRSLADFAKIVERLDAAGGSFVSVTQAFNTTTSMGRLTLNVLLSFAQFEREVTGERIRDKIAASKAKGMWMGGNLPLGYDAPVDPVTRALVVNSEEAELVRYIFRTYLELGSVVQLIRRLTAEGVCSKRNVTRDGRPRGGANFTRGAMCHLLKNPVYVGEIPHREKVYPGNHEAILDRELFDAVQTKLATHRSTWKRRPLRTATMPLKGKLYGSQGEPMTPSWTQRAAGIYRYYVSAALVQGRAGPAVPGAIRRVTADEVEGVIERELRVRLGANTESLKDLLACVQRIDLDPQAIRISFVRRLTPRSAIVDAETDLNDSRLAVVTLPVRCKLRGGRNWIVGPPGSEATIRTRRDPTLIKGLQQAHRILARHGWRPDGVIEDGRSMVAPPNPYERKLCRLALLAPDIQKRILEGRQPRSLTLDQLINSPIPTGWPAQRAAFGFDAIG